jgi:FkbM family methyltransferase
MAFPAARIVAVEPDPLNAEICRLNTAGHDVEVLEQAIGSQPGAVRLITDGRDAWSVATERAPDGEVQSCTVPELVAERAPRRVSSSW